MKVLVLAVHGLNPGYIGCYGNDWIDTTSLDRLATEGVVFDQHFADVPDAAGAFRAWRTGQFAFPSTLPPTLAGASDLIAELKQAGVQTRRIVDGSRPFEDDFGSHWDHVEQIPVSAAEGTPLEHTLEATRVELEQLAGQDRWLLWVDFATLLPPWDLPLDYLVAYFPEATDEGPEEVADDEPFAPLTKPVMGMLAADDETTFLSLQRTYAAAVTYLDSGLGLLLEEMKRLYPAENVAIIVTSDRGLPLGEHGLVGWDRAWLHEELVHLPLLVRLPGQERAGRRVTALTQAVDLLPTLCGLFEVTVPAVHGRSLLPLLRGEMEEVRPYLCTGLRVGQSLEWSLRTPELVFLLPLTMPDGDAARITGLTLPGLAGSATSQRYRILVGLA